MAITVNTNVTSLSSQRLLNGSANSLSQSLQRLSSGLRINSAKDDAAGLAISQTMSSAIRGNNQAMKNANDGLSVAQTAEGALGQIANSMQRIREIAVQASNGSVSDTNRSQLQNEADQLTQEISRIIQTTEFNGTKLLSGGKELTFQVGSFGQKDNQLSIQTTDLTSSAAASKDTSAAGLAKVATDAKTKADAAETAWNDAKGADPKLGVTPETIAAREKEYKQAQVAFLGADLAAKQKLVDEKDAAWRAETDAGKKTTLEGELKTARDGVATATNALNTFKDANPGIGSKGALNSYNSDLAAIKTIDISTQKSAQDALSKLDADIGQISNLRSTFGSVMNRFEAVVNNLGNYTENLTAANSRIMDVDFASETATMTKHQILQQAGTSVLKQANQLPQAALSLLQ
nr:flagellin [Chromobacterium sp. ASV5]